jgi:hypothetical protein
VTGRAPGRKAPKPVQDASTGVGDRPRGIAAFLTRGGALGLAVLALAAAAAVLMVATELSTLREVDVVTATCEDLADPAQKEDCELTGGEQHSYALVVVAVLALLMGWGAGPGRSRPAAVALAVAGLLALGIALLGDLPDVGEEGALGRTFEQAEAKAGPALTYEIVGGVLALVAGLLGLVRPRRR